MTRLYGNLADAVLGEARFAGRLPERALEPTPTRPIGPATKVIAGLILLLLGLVALAVLVAAPDRFAAATPPLADLQDWRVWHELMSL